MRHRSRLLVLTAIAVLAIGATGCGSDGGAGAGDASKETEASPNASEKEKARATVEGLYASMRDGAAEGVCSRLSEPAQKQVAAGGIGVGKGDSCAEAFQRFLDAAEKQGGLSLTLKAKVRRVTLTGDTGIAKVAFGPGRVGEIPLVKADGEWKLDRVGASPQQQ